MNSAICSICPNNIPILKRKRKFCSRKCFFNSMRGRVRTHGLTKTKFYYTWVNMENRCKRNTTKKYERYGKRGIQLKWDNINEFINDMYESYLKHVQQFGEKDTTIERIDNDGNYCKENCRWATKAEQMRNMSTNHFIKYKGEIKTLIEWSEILKFDYKFIWGRLKHGWSFSDALAKPMDSKLKSKLYKYNGRLLNTKQLAKEMGVNYTTLWRKLNK